MVMITKRQFASLAVAAGASRVLPASAAVTITPVQASLNENPYGPSPKVLEALRRATVTVNRYGDSGAADDLVAQIAALEGVATEQVILGEILAPLGLFLATTGQRGGNFVYSTPGYGALVDAGRPAGTAVKGVPLGLDLRNDLPALARAVTAETKALYLVNPHNPSGTINAPGDFRRFLRDVSTRTLVIVDEAYLEFSSTAQSAVSLTRAGANVAVFRTLDKVYGLAGLPIGYLLAPRPLARALRDAGFGDPHELGSLAIDAARAALADQAWVRTVRERIAASRARLTQALDDLHLSHTASEANFVFFESPIAASQARAQLATQGIVVARAFTPLENWIRISIGTDAQVDRTISALRVVYGR